MFELEDPAAIARSLKQSAERSRRRKSDPFRSAMSMLTFYMRNDFVSLDRPDPLTDRETEILRLMASGFSNKEIANSLGVAEGTIKNHVSNILSKLGVRDRTRAVLKAFELQLV